MSRTRAILVVCLLLCLLASAALADPLHQVKIVNGRAPDCSSLDSIVHSITQGCKTDDERVIAIYNFCRYDHYHHAYPTESGGVSALKFINVYGWGLCGGQHTVMAALWEAAGYKWRYRGWRRPGHTTVEVFYGGRWHYLDTFLKFYAWAPDPQSPGGRTIASQEDILANPELVTNAFVMDPSRKVCYHKNNRFDYVGEKANWTAPAFMVCGDTLEGVLSGVGSSRDAGSPRGWGGIRFDDPNYSTDVNLRPGYALTLDWNKIDDAYYFRGRKNPPHHSCGDKDYRNCPAIGPILEPYDAYGRERTWSNGTLVFRPDLGNATALGSFRKTDNVVLRDGAIHLADVAQPGVVVIEMASPYVIAKASGKMTSESAAAELSTDLKTWKPIKLDDLSEAVRGTYGYYVRVTFRKPLTAVELTSVVQHNQEALPYLAPGRNKITVTAANPDTLGENRLVITYAYSLGRREQTPEGIFDRDVEIARAHYATWSDTPVVVQKTVTRFPASFEIPIPTPRGKQPVYPRMLFLRREVLAPDQQPMDVPVAPSTPTVGSGDYLPDVPNPWLIGTGEPMTRDDRPTETKVVPPARLSYVSKQGEVFEHQFIKWLKDNSDAWILLADFDVTDLPDAKSLASAKLIVYIHESHNRAPMQAAAVTLKGPFETGKSFDFTNLGQALGTTIVRQGNGPGAPFVPPRRYEVDVTRLVRGWSKGEPQHGLALRIIPNRAVDDGWTVRFTPAEGKPVELLIATYR